MQHTSLRIEYCDQIEEIITKQREEEESQIVFNKLRYLVLDNLPSLESFCRHIYSLQFPLLGDVLK